jgi:phosphoglycerate dehydrogenase-like enzyme
MKVLFTKPFFEADIRYITDRLTDGIELVAPADYTPAAIAASAQEADVLFGGTINDQILTEAANLKFIQVPWTGVDSLDFELLKKHNVTIANSHSNAVIVAEHAVALMLDAGKKIAYHDRLMRSGEWNRVKPGNANEVSPFSKMASGATVAIVGFGAIGKGIYKLLSGFSCNFKVFNRSGKATEGYADKGNLQFFPIDERDGKLNDADFVFICIPLTPDTKELVDAQFLEKLNSKSVLINVSRGEAINEDALFNWLTSNKDAFAAIDTWYNYPTKDNPSPYPSLKNNFHELNNLILSPHRAGYTDAGFLHLDDAIENLNRFKQGRKLINVISLNDKY